MRFRPFGNGVLVIGRYINVVAGFATLVAHYTYASNSFSTNFWIFGAICLVMGGALTMVGGNTVSFNLMQVQLGWCCQLGTYFGVLVTITEAIPLLMACSSVRTAGNSGCSWALLT